MKEAVTVVIPQLFMVQQFHRPKFISADSILEECFSQRTQSSSQFKILNFSNRRQER